MSAVSHSSTWFLCDAHPAHTHMSHPLVHSVASQRTKHT